jgi:GT2 family glycosyltransferase
VKHTLKDVSIVIVTYKGDDLTQDCLESLSETCGTDPQIVVVDNSPSQSTRNIVAAHANAVYVASPGNPGFAGGNNRALQYCDRDYILLLNNDTIVHTS